MKRLEIRGVVEKVGVRNAYRGYLKSTMPVTHQMLLPSEERRPLYRRENQDITFAWSPQPQKLTVKATCPVITKRMSTVFYQIHQE